MADQYTWGFLGKELIVESLFTFIADIFPAFSAGNRFCDFFAAMGFPLLADNVNSDLGLGIGLTTGKAIPFKIST